MSKELSDRPQVMWKGVGAHVGRPHTTGAPSVFAIADVKRREPSSAPNELKVIPIPAEKGPKRVSPWKAIYENIPKGKAVELTKAQAMSLASWSRQHKQKLHRAMIEGSDLYAVWRPDASYQSS